MTLASTIDRPAAANQDTADVFHLGLNVSELDRSLRFYTALFGQAASRHFNDFARFELTEPPIVVALYPNPQVSGGALNHVGLRLRDSAQLVEVQRRLEQAGIPTQRQEDVECCYSRQTKFWITDPDRNLWEIYTFEEDLDHSGFDDAPVAVRSAAPQSIWQHRLTELVPASLPFADGTIDEVLLEGTVNALLPAGALSNLLREAYRVLKSGGRVVIHGLVSDRLFPGTPQLPGMAAIVQTVPVESEPLDLLRDSGFVDLLYDKLAPIGCFEVNGVELRELRLAATKPGTETRSDVFVVYKGPFAEIELDEGIVLRRGEIKRLPVAVLDRLMAGPAASTFGRVQTSCGGEMK